VAGVRGLVLDLRGNPGGSILQGLQVLDRFLDEGELGYRRVRGVSVPIAYANPRSVTLPLVVVVDEDTASTAEIVAGTLQAYGRAPLVGARTSGKGVGQTAVPLSDGAELRLVSFEWLLPGLRSVEGTGLTPDVMVLEKAREPDAATPLTMAAILETDLDPPLRAAIERLREELGDDLEARSPIPVPRVDVEPVMVPVPEDQDAPRDAPDDD
jgi:C-terminal peptidase prc